jgi:hypothetical protein
MSDITPTSWNSNIPYKLDKKIYSKRNVLQFTRKNNMVDSSTRTRHLANINLMKSINSRDGNHKAMNNSYALKNGIVQKYNNHTNMLHISQGYHLLNKDCRSSSIYANEISDSNNTYVDLKLDFLNADKNSQWITPPAVGTTEQKEGIQIKNNISQKKNPTLGLMSEQSMFNDYKYTKINFFKHAKIKQLKKSCDDPKNIKVDNNKFVNVHPIDNKSLHHHYFPISLDDGRVTFGHYTHKHSENPHDNSDIPIHTPNYSSFAFRFARFPNNKYSLS